jgi:hypothetical protein
MVMGRSRPLSPGDLAKLDEDRRRLVERKQPTVDVGQKLRDEMFRYAQPVAHISLNKGWTTRQVTLLTTGTLIIETFRPAMYIMTTDSDEPVYLGANINVTITSGFAWRRTDAEFIFAMRENSRLYAIKHPSLAALTIKIYLLEMGV